MGVAVPHRYTANQRPVSCFCNPGQASRLPLFFVRRFDFANCGRSGARFRSVLRGGDYQRVEKIKDCLRPEVHGEIVQPSEDHGKERESFVFESPQDHSQGWKNPVFESPKDYSQGRENLEEFESIGTAR